MSRRLVAAAVVGLTTSVCSLGTSVIASTDPDARLDAAMEAFNARMIAAGWASQGPSEDDDDADEFTGDEEIFAECLGDVGILVPNPDANEFPGQTASSASDEFIYAPAMGIPATTDPFALEVNEETALAIAASVDEANVATVTEYLEVMGAKHTGDCLQQVLEAEVEAESDESDMAGGFDVHASNEPDLGIGDHSVALRYEVSTEFIVPITVEIQVVLAQTGRDVVGVAHVVAGESVSGFDPRSELQTIVDSLGG